jgi:metabolite-proton symporter
MNESKPRTRHPAPCQPDDPVATSPLRRAASASLIGTAIESYDFYIYGTAAALVFNALFFPSADPTVATIVAFATFAIGFLARPIGGAILGHFGDRIGRKSMLVLTLLMMGVATVGIGLLPTYAAIGVWAPILLVTLRLVQGLAAGGEWAGAVLMTIEHAPHARRGFFGGITQAAAPLAFVLSNGVFLVLSATLTSKELVSWGWRVPFLLSIVLIVVGVVIRSRVEETPEFTRLAKSGARVAVPIVAVWRHHTGAIVLTALAVVSSTATAYINTVYVLSYATQVLGVPRGGLVAIATGNGALGILLVLAFARLSDRIGHKRVFVIGAVIALVWAIPYFLLTDTGSLFMIALAQLVSGIGSGAMFAPLPALVAELFGPEVRYTGVTIGYQAGTILGGGFAPLVAASLFAATHGTLSIGLYVAAITALSLGAVLLVTTTRQRPSPIAHAHD